LDLIMDAPVKPARDLADGDAAHKIRLLLIHFSNSQAPSPVFFAAPGTPSPFSLPSKYEGGWRGRCHDLEYPHSLSRVRSASRRATQTSLRSLGVFADVLLTAPGRAFRGPLVKAAQPLPGLPPFLAASPAAPADGRNGLRQPAPGRRPVVATGRSPGAARVLGGAFISRPRAPHPAPSSDAS
jgi:hypothetical protein